MGVFFQDRGLVGRSVGCVLQLKLSALIPGRTIKLIAVAVGGHGRTQLVQGLAFCAYNMLRYEAWASCAFALIVPNERSGPVAGRSPAARVARRTWNYSCAKLL